MVCRKRRKQAKGQFRVKGKFAVHVPAAASLAGDGGSATVRSRGPRCCLLGRRWGKGDGCHPDALYSGHSAPLFPPLGVAGGRPKLANRLRSATAKARPSSPSLGGDGARGEVGDRMRSAPAKASPLSGAGGRAPAALRIQEGGALRRFRCASSSSSSGTSSECCLAVAPIGPHSGEGTSKVRRNVEYIELVTSSDDEKEKEKEKEKQKKMVSPALHDFRSKQKNKEKEKQTATLHKSTSVISKKKKKKDEVKP